MQTRHFVGSLSLLAAAAAGTAIGLSHVATAATAMDRIVVFEPDTERVEVFVDVGDAGFGAGDLVFEQAGLVWPDNGDAAGRVVTRIQVVEGRVAPSDEDPVGDFVFYLDCSVELDEGSLDFHGAGEIADLPGSGLTFAISGGTGAYVGAAGTVHITPAEVDGISGVQLAFDVG